MNSKLEAKAVRVAVAKLKPRTQAFIDGKFIKAQSRKTFTTENPATGKPLAEIAACAAPTAGRGDQGRVRSTTAGVAAVRRGSA